MYIVQLKKLKNERHSTVTNFHHVIQFVSIGALVRESIICVNCQKRRWTLDIVYDGITVDVCHKKSVEDDVRSAGARLQRSILQYNPHHVD